MNKLQIAVLSASLGEKSRSRLATEFAINQLQKSNCDVELIDIRCLNLEVYPRSSDDVNILNMTNILNKADAWLIAGPVYNWTASGGLITFMNYWLNETTPRYRPFCMIAGAGGDKSFLAFETISRMLIHEAHAIQVGPAILVAGEDADRDTGVIVDGVQERLVRAVSTLAHVARSMSIEQSAGLVS